MKKFLVISGIAVICTALYAATANMGLVLPVVGVTTGPDWATMINQAFNVIDVHDHSPGKGVQITNAGISSAAAIARSKLATGGASFVVINGTDGLLSQEQVLTVPHGGTGNSGYVPGDLLYACSATGLCPLHKGTANQLLKMIGGAPVWATVSPGAAPTVQKFTSGSGTYVLPSSPTPVYIEVELVGPGGGGGAQATNNGSNGSAATTFGTTLLSAGAGTGGQNGGSPGGTGGAASITGVTFAGVAIAGSSGQGGFNNSVANVIPSGGQGGASAFGGSGSGGQGANDGTAAATNSGAGGGGAGGASGAPSGGGGGSGGYVKAKSVTTPSSTYPYVVGSGGSGGAAGTHAGGAGAAGIIVVTEFY